MTGSASVAAANAAAVGQMQSAKYDMYGQLGSAVIGSIGSLFGANASSKKQFKYQSALQKQAAKLNYEYAEKTARNSPTWNRAGLESAGYNPMLAVQNATNGANSSWTSAGQATAPDYVGAISQGVANAQSFQRLKNETQQAESVADANYANADKAKAEANESVLRSKFIPDKEKSIIAKQNAEAKKLENDIHIAEEQIKLGQMGITVQQQSNANQAERNRILEKSMPSGRSQSFNNYTSGVRNIFSGIGDIIHGRNDYENYYEERQVTNGPKGRSSEKVTSRRSGRRKKG